MLNIIKEVNKDDGFGMTTQNNDILLSYNDARHERLGEHGQPGLACAWVFPSPGLVCKWQKSQSE